MSRAGLCCLCTYSNFPFSASTGGRLGGRYRCVCSGLQLEFCQPTCLACLPQEVLKKFTFPASSGQSQQQPELVCEDVQPYQLPLLLELSLPSACMPSGWGGQGQGPTGRTWSRCWARGSRGCPSAQPGSGSSLP